MYRLYVCSGFLSVLLDVLLMGCLFGCSVSFISCFVILFFGGGMLWRMLVSFVVSLVCFVLYVVMQGLNGTSFFCSSLL